MMQTEIIQPEHIVFALDIGTRSVIGILGEIQGDGVRVIDVEIKEHTKRAMIDGQIEDIAMVAKVAKDVKKALEERNNMKLTRVSVAAAGRALKTHRVSKTMNIDSSMAIEAAKVAEMEAKALEQANLEMFPDQETMAASQFYCVGYSVMKYYLDGYPISNLVGHRGQEVKIDILATFLPNAVVESLYATMTSIDLEIESLTLEPIAAMNLVIPPELRNLNLALVDIGAGTSDIAISREGSVVAYAMATVAGDELTEAISNAFLVDFHEAERIKHALSTQEKINFTDILGMEYELSNEEIFAQVKPALDTLTSVIAEKILEANGSAPAAVFLVGGASKIPTIADLVSAKLNMDIRKVAVGGSLSIRKQVTSDFDVFHPEYATPLGILLTALRSKENDGLAVMINGKRSRLLIKRSTSVIDILLANGYQYQEMIASSGRNLIYTWNGQSKILRGSYATPAQILVNDKPVNVFTQVKGGDVITFTPAVPGKDAKATLAQLIDDRPFEVLFNGKKSMAGTLYHVNGALVSMDYEIQQGDDIWTVELTTLGDFCLYYKIETQRQRFIVQGEEASLDRILHADDEIETMPYLPAAPVQMGFSEPSENLHHATEMIQEETFDSGDDTKENAMVNGEFSVMVNGQTVVLPNSPTGYMFCDMLNYIDIDLKQVKGHVMLKLNGKEASYLDPVKSGDDIVITWEE